MAAFGVRGRIPDRKYLDSFAESFWKDQSPVKMLDGLQEGRSHVMRLACMLSHTHTSHTATPEVEMVDDLFL